MAAREISALPHRAATDASSETVARWSHEEIFARGYLTVPSIFLRVYARLKPKPLTTGEALFILHLMDFKWGAASPFPGYKTLAKRMGISDKMARRYARSLEEKGFLVREARIGSVANAA